MFIEDNDTLFFGDILSLALKEKNLVFRDFSSERGYKNVKLSHSTISQYISGFNTPSYELAREILIALDIQIAEEDLIKVLKRSRKRAKQRKKYYTEEATDIRKTITVRIKPENISPELSVYQGARIIEERIKYLFGNEKKFSEYVKMLVIKDIKEFILEKEEVKNE